MQKLVTNRKRYEIFGKKENCRTLLQEAVRCVNSLDMLCRVYENTGLEKILLCRDIYWRDVKYFPLIFVPFFYFLIVMC